MRSRGIRQTRRGVAVFVVCVLGALPFLLYESTPVYLLLMAFTLSACLYWIAVSTGNSVESRVSGFVITDWLNQVFAVPFSNFLGLFISIRTAAKDTKRGKAVLIGVIGLCVAIPLIIGVTSLLINSDKGFEQFASDFSGWIGLNDIGSYLLKFIGGVPIACYIFGAVCGNIQKRYTGLVTKEGAEKNLAAARRIPRAAVLTPLAVLCALYVVYISVMSVYLFSAFTGNLPSGFTYAEYARTGFFELCGVAAINLFVLIFTYVFTSRGAGEYPKAMRVFSALLCLLTELLIATATSKMLLYIDAYGLSRLRVYTLWFLVLLFVVFALLIVWHIRTYTAAATRAKPFNAGRPIVIVSVCFLLALFLANTDGLIAKYNVWQYSSGHTRTVDTAMLSGMSGAVLPYLADLRDNAADESVRAEAQAAIDKKKDLLGYSGGAAPGANVRFQSWSIQKALTEKYLQ